MYLYYDDKVHKPYIYNFNNNRTDYLDSWSLMGINYKDKLTDEVYPYYYVGVLRWGKGCYIRFLFARSLDSEDDIYSLIVLKDLDSYLGD